MWTKLQQGIEQVFANQGRISMFHYMTLYTHVCNFITRTKPKNVRSGEGDAQFSWETAAGYELYGRLQRFLRSYVEALVHDASDLAHEDVLKFYSDKWESFKRSSSVLNSVFSFLNNNWLKKEWKEGKKNVYDTTNLCMLFWKDIFWQAIRSHLTKAILKQINSDRSGESIDGRLVQGILASIVELGLNEEGPTDMRPNLSVYKSDFENLFLENTDSFYRREGTAFFNQNPVTEYMKRVEQWLAEEERRVQRYLHESTLEPLADTMQRALIEQNLDIFGNEFKNLLQDDRCDDLSRMYRLVSRTANGLGNLRVLFGQHVLNKGLLAIERVTEDGFQDPKLYVNTLLLAHQKYNMLVLTTFKNDVGFAESFDKACIGFMNTNAVTQLAKSPEKSPELLARYCDMMLKKAAEHFDRSDLEYRMDQVIIVLKYIKDKDVFQKFYSRMLAKRLVLHQPFSDDAEASMIFKLKLECGSSFVWTMQSMVHDMAVSKHVNEKFIEHVQKSGENLGLDFSIQVLTSESWPFRHSFALDLPLELEHSVQRFTQFYSQRHSARKLHWLHNFSRGELLTNCFQASYTLQASTCQIAVLLRFNHALSFTVQQLQEGTGMPMAFLRQVLQTLLKFKLLVCVEAGVLASGDLRPETIVSLFEGYNQKKIRVNINVPLNPNVKEQQEGTENKRHEDRKMLIQACIVRIMKQRGTLKHGDLQEEVLRRLNSNFEPHVPIINECIKMLIDKEYLERAEDQADTYKYLA